MSSFAHKPALAVVALLGKLSFTAMAAAAEKKVELTGAEEIPPVTTSASGLGTIKINEDETVSGSITTKAVEGTAAHIHRAPAGKSGPPVITLTQTSPGVWSVPEGAQLTHEQYAAFKAGELYINVHSAAHERAA